MAQFFPFSSILWRDGLWSLERWVLVDDGVCSTSYRGLSPGGGTSRIAPPENRGCTTGKTRVLPPENRVAPLEKPGFCRRKTGFCRRKTGLCRWKTEVAPPENRGCSGRNPKSPSTLQLSKTPYSSSLTLPQAAVDPSTDQDAVLIFTDATQGRRRPFPNSRRRNVPTSHS